MSPPQSVLSDEPGLQPIHVASLEGDFAAVERLVLEEGNTHLRTEQGETPLILASLMGHVEVVTILALHGAKFESCDGYCRNALSYASEDAFCYIRRQAFAQWGFLETAGAKYRRVLIANFLNPAPFRPWKHTSEAASSGAFHKTSNGVEALIRISVVKAPGRIDPRQKTVGFIRSATESRPLKWAFSGCPKTQRPESSQLQLLDGKTWTRTVLRKVAPAINFQFDHHQNDQFFARGTLPEHKRGRYFACHVECKLAVWYCFSLLAASKSMPNMSKTFCARNLGDLLKTDLGDSRRAVIEIDQPACESCGRFLKALERATGIEFEISYRSSVALIPNVIKRRSYFLAHESMHSEFLEQENTVDPGSGTETDTDADFSNDIVEYNNKVEDEEPLLGDEEFEIISSHSSLQGRPRQFQSQTDELEEEADSIVRDDLDSEFSEDYAYDKADKSYSARRPRGTETRNAKVITDKPFDDDEDIVIVESAVSSPPQTPSRMPLPMTPFSGFGSVERPIEVPSSPTESLFAARQDRKRMRAVDDDESVREQLRNEGVDRRAREEKHRRAQIKQARLEAARARATGTQMKVASTKFPDSNDDLPPSAAGSAMQDIEMDAPSHASELHRHRHTKDNATALRASNAGGSTKASTPEFNEASSSETAIMSDDGGDVDSFEPAQPRVSTQPASRSIATPRRLAWQNRNSIESLSLEDAKSIIRNYTYPGNPPVTPKKHQKSIKCPDTHSGAYFVPKDVN